jgi:hypothetical protein
MSVNVQFDFDLDQFNHVMDIVAPERARLALGSLLSGTRMLILRNAQIEAPVRTGNLRRSGFSDVDKDALVAHVAFGGAELLQNGHVDYAAMVEGGTGPHPIYPKLASALRFIATSYGSQAAAQRASSGSRATGTAKKGFEDIYIFRNFVLHHPGTVANPFLDRGYQHSEDEITNLMGRVAVRFMRAEQAVDEP